MTNGTTDGTTREEYIRMAPRFGMPVNRGTRALRGAVWDAMERGEPTVVEQTAAREYMDLYLEGNVWMVCHRGARRSYIMGLFGTCDLPTPYTSQTTYETVAATLQRLNPDAIIQRQVPMGRPIS